jgi:hypothetical protein
MQDLGRVLSRPANDLVPEDLLPKEIPPLGSTNNPVSGTSWNPPTGPPLHPVAASRVGPASPKLVRQDRSVESRSGSFRPVDIIYIVVGVLAALSGLSAMLSILISIPSLLSTSAMSSQPGVEISGSIKQSMLTISIGSILSHAVRVALGACGVGVVCYVCEKRTKGKSSFQWTLLAGAIAGGVSIASSVINSLVLFLALSNSAIFPITGLSVASSIFGLAMGSIIPVAMIVLYADRKKLKYRELLS